MVDVYSDGDGSDLGATASLRVMCWLRCTGKIALCLESGFSSNERTTA